MTTLGPEVDGAIAATLSRFELVRQVAAADARAHASGAAQHGLSGLPSSVLALLATEALHNRKLAAQAPAVAAQASVTPIEAELPSQSVQTFPPLPANRATQTWHPPSASAAKPTGIASVVSAGPWRSLRRRPKHSSASECKKEELADAVEHAEVDYDDSFHTDADSASELPAASPHGTARSLEQFHSAADNESAGSDHQTPSARPRGDDGRSSGSSCESARESQCNPSQVESGDFQAEDEVRLSPEAAVSQVRNSRELLLETESPLNFLRALLLDASRVTEWYPQDESSKLEKAAILGEQVPQMLDALEAAVLDAVLFDTARELTRLDISRTLAEQSQAQNEANSPHEFACTQGKGAVLSYVQLCANFEDTLRQKYL